MNSLLDTSFYLVICGVFAVLAVAGGRVQRTALALRNKWTPPLVCPRCAAQVDNGEVAATARNHTPKKWYGISTVIQHCPNCRGTVGPASSNRISAGILLFGALLVAPLGVVVDESTHVLRLVFLISALALIYFGLRAYFLGLYLEIGPDG